MAPRLFIFQQDGSRRFAHWERGRLAGYGVSPTIGPHRPGAIYLGRIAKVDRPLGVAFVQFTDTEAGLLPLATSVKLVEGQSIPVQLLREARGDKLPKLTRSVTLTGRYLQLQPGRPGLSSYPQQPGKELANRLRTLLAQAVPERHGFVARPAAATAADDALRREASALIEQWGAIVADAAKGPGPRLLRAGPSPLDVFLRDLDPSNAASILCADRTTTAQIEQRTHGQPRAIDVRMVPTGEWSPSLPEIGEAVADALEPLIEMPGGGSLQFDLGQALTAIDVNAANAANRGGKAGNAEDRRFAINLAAAQEIAHQIRLRNLGGPIVIDFIGVRRPEHRRNVVAMLRQACLPDPQPCQILEMSPLGLVEMARQSIGPTLAEQLAIGPSLGRTG